MFKNIGYSLLIITSLVIISSCNLISSSDKEEEDKIKNPILINSQRDIENGELYIMDENGENVKRLTNNNFNESGGVFSPDKKRIAFSSTENNSNSNIFFISDEGEKLKQISDLDAKIYDFSPDGKQVVMTWHRQNDYNIFKMDTTGNNVERLTDLTSTQSVINVSPTWSPDGSKIAYVQKGQLYTGESLWNIFIINSDGTNKYQLTKDSTGNHHYRSPKWISNNSISFNHTNTEGTGREREIMKMDIDSDEKEVIVKHDGAGYTWSPDFTKIAYQKYVLGTDGEDGDQEIFVYDLENNTTKRLTDNKGHDDILDW